MFKYRIKISALLLVAVALFLAVPFSAEAAKTVSPIRSAFHQSYFALPVQLAAKGGIKLTKTGNGATDKVKKVSFEASELPMPYDELLTELTHGRLEKEKLEVKSRSSFIWNGDRAELLKLFQKNGAMTIAKWVLVIDRGENCWLLSGFYNSKNSQTGQAVLDTLKTAWWEKLQAKEEKTPLLLGASDTKGTPFMLAGFRQGSLIYTKDGAIPTKDKDQALFVITSLSREYVPQEERAGRAAALLDKIERGAKLEIISQTEEKIDNSPAVVTVAYTGTKALIYQAVIFRPDEVLTMVGIARQNTAKNLESFHKLTASYKGK